MPTIDDARFDLRARLEQRAKVRELPDPHLAEVVAVQKEESRRANERVRKDWDDAWRFYRSEVSFGDKEEWQSQVWVPMPFAAVEQATALIQRSMIDSPQFFGVEGTSPRDKMLAEHVWAPTLALAFAKNQFAHKFSDAVKMGFITGQSLYLKFRFKPFRIPTLAGTHVDLETGEILPVYNAQTRHFLAIETVPPWNVYRDPRSRPREQYSGTYLIHEELVGRDFLGGEQARYFRNLDQVRELGTSGGGEAYGTYNSPDRQFQRKQQTWAPHKLRRDYTANEWYGDVLDENGDPVYPDAMMTKLNDTVIYGPVDNPLWAVDPVTGRRKWPLIAFSPIADPLRFEGHGILTAVAPIAVLFTNLFNLFADGMNWEVNPETEVDLSLLHNWDDVERYPGKTWLKSKSGDALKPAQSGRMNVATVLGALQFLDSQWQNNSFVTAFVAGLPGTRSNITLGETKIKTQQSQGVFDGMARNLEDGGVACVELAFDFLFQYLAHWKEPQLEAIVGARAASYLEQLGVAERMSVLGGTFNYLFTGISASIKQADLLGRIMQGAQIATAGPYLGFTNPKDWLTAIVDALNLGDKIDVQDQPMIPVAQAQEMVRQAMQKAAAPPPRVGITLKGDLDPLTAKDLADGTLDAHAGPFPLPNAAALPPAEAPPSAGTPAPGGPMPSVPTRELVPAEAQP